DRLPDSAVGHEGADPAVEVATDAMRGLFGVARQGFAEAEAGAVAEAIGAPRPIVPAAAWACRLSPHRRDVAGAGMLLRENRYKHVSTKLARANHHDLTRPHRQMCGRLPEP